MKVRSHVSRDVLQNAGLFKNERLAVWEYVSNSLQYVEKQVSPVVSVEIDSKNKKISIQDNGRGMNWNGLGNYFIMHGENIDRLEGKPGRGKYGTGKSAAFGIGEVLRITTVKDGLSSSVELTRSDLDSVRSGDDVPVRKIFKDKSAKRPNGTLIEIEKVQLKSIDQAMVIAYIERHLAKWPKDVVVTVNKHRCEFIEPSIDREIEYPVPDKLVDILGQSTLKVKVSKSPLDPDLRGISVFSSGVWLETTLLESHGKEMSEFIHGEFDVETLEKDKSIPSAFDVSRSMKLNPNNIIVKEIYRFVGPRIEEVRKLLTEEHKVEKATEEARKLDAEAEKIEDLINTDFNAYRNKLKKAKYAISGEGFDSGSTKKQGELEGDDDFIFGGIDPAETVDEEGSPGGADGGSNSWSGGSPRRLNPIVKPSDFGTQKGHKASSGKRRKPKGGFHIEFKNSGNEGSRAKYESDLRTIFVNLDHPQIAASMENRSAEDPIFRRLAYEVAFTEYAIALSSELNNHGEYIDTSDPIYDIRESINRLARDAASLYK